MTYKYKAYSDESLKELVSFFPIELLILWAAKLNLRIIGTKYEEILNSFIKNLENVPITQKKQIFNLYKNGIRPSSFIIESSNIITEKLLWSIIRGFKTIIQKSLKEKDNRGKYVKFLGLEILNSKFLEISDSSDDVRLAKIFFTFVGKEVETEVGIVPSRGFGIIVIRPLKEFFEIRCNDVKVVDWIINFLFDKFKIEFKRIKLSDKTVQDILDWAYRVNLASIQLFEGPLHRHIMSTKKKKDLRDVETFKKELKKGKITSFHISVFTEEDYEIGFKLNPKLGRISFTKIVSEHEIEQILSEIFRIYQGKKVVEKSGFTLRRGKKYAKLDIFLQ